MASGPFYPSNNQVTNYGTTGPRHHQRSSLTGRGRRVLSYPRVCNADAARGALAQTVRRRFGRRCRFVAQCTASTAFDGSLMSRGSTIGGSLLVISIPTEQADHPRHLSRQRERYNGYGKRDPYHTQMPNRGWANQCANDYDLDRDHVHDDERRDPVLPAIHDTAPPHVPHTPTDPGMSHTSHVPSASSGSSSGGVGAANAGGGVFPMGGPRSRRPI